MCPGPGVPGKRGAALPGVWPGPGHARTVALPGGGDPGAVALPGYARPPGARPCGAPGVCPTPPHPGVVVHRTRDSTIVVWVVVCCCWTLELDRFGGRLQICRHAAYSTVLSRGTYRVVC